MATPISIVNDAIQRNQRVQFIGAKDRKIRWTHIVDYRIQDNILVVCLMGIDVPTRTDVNVKNYRGHESAPETSPNDPNTKLVLEDHDGSLVVIFNHV